MKIVRFFHEDVDRFSEASHDRSRLHMCDAYARQTIYGEPIVFGILGAFAVLGALPDRPRQELATVSLKYRQPLYMGVDYQVEIGESSSTRAKVALLKQGQIMTSGQFTFRDRRGTGAEVEGIAPRSE